MDMCAKRQYFDLSKTSKYNLFQLSGPDFY